MKTIDVQGMIRQASRRVGLDQLARQGKKYIALLSREKMADLIHQAAKTIADKYRAESGDLSAVPADRIEAESRVEFDEILRQYELTDKAKSDVEQSKQSLVEELAGLRAELGRQKGADRIEKRLVAGFQAFASELDRQVVQVFERRRLILAHSGSPDEGTELQEVETVLRAIIERIVAAERERFEIWGGRTREFGMLQKRIGKLQDHIVTMEAAFKTLADSKAFSNQHVQNVLRQLGLVADDKHFEKKREMLKVVLDANKEQKARAADFERQGITLADPGRNGSALRISPV